MPRYFSLKTKKPLFLVVYIATRFGIQTDPIQLDLGFASANAWRFSCRLPSSAFKKINTIANKLTGRRERHDIPTFTKASVLRNSACFLIHFCDDQRRLDALLSE